MCKIRRMKTLNVKVVPSNYLMEHHEEEAFFTAHILSGHSWKDTGVANNINDGSVLF